MTELRDGFPDALVPEAAPVQLPSDAFQWETGASDASAGVLLDAAAAAIVPALQDAPYAEKLAAPEPAVPARAAKVRPDQLPPAAAKALCIPDGAPSAA